MPSGQYTIDDSSRSRGDTSFRACVIALLIFLLFCVTIIIVLLVVNKDVGRGGAAESEHSGTASKHTGDEAEKEDRRRSESESGEAAPAAPSSTPEPPTPGGKTTAATSTRPSSADEPASTDPSEDRSASESKHVRTELGARKVLVGAVESTSTELSVTTFLEVLPDVHTLTENETLSGNTTSTELPLKTSKNVSADSSHAEEHAIDSTGNLTSTSTEPPASTSTLPTATEEVRRSMEESVDSTTNFTEHYLRLAEPPIIPTTPPPPIKPVPCTSPECKRLAANVLATMGLDAEPCKQFYEFACGGLRENKYLLEPDYEEEAWLRINGMVDKINSSSPESYKMFKKLIQSCQTFDPVKDINTWKEAVNKEIKDLGGFAVDDAEFTKNFTHLFLGLLQNDRPFIFEVTLDVNDKSPSRFAIKILPAAMMDNQLYPEDNGALECQAKAAAKHKNLNDIYDETLDCMNNDIGRTKAYEAAKEALLTLGIFSADDEADKLNKTLHDYVEFLVQNNNALGDKIARRLQLENREPDLHTVKELNEMFESVLMVDWSAIIENLIGRALNDDERVQVYSVTYFKKLDHKFKLQARQLHNALLVGLAAARHRDLVAEQRWRPHVFPAHCTRLAARLLPDAATALYLHSFSEARRAQLEAQASDLLFDLTLIYLRELDRAPWLNHDPAMRELKKDLEYKMEWIKDTRNITEHTRHVMDTDVLDAALKDYTIDEKGFIKNAIMLMARNRKLLYKRIDEEPINNIWTHFIHPYDTTGITLHSLNFIAIPLGAIEKPFYDPEYLRHMRLAGLGFSVAHEMAHHIDSLGMKFNTTSKELTDDYKEKIPRFYVWKKEVIVEYLNVTGSNKHRIVQFQFAESDLKDKEFFADKIAIHLAYQTYKKKAKKSDKVLPYLPLTNDQSFFVFLAQKFCTKLDYFSMVLDFFESPFFPPETRVKNMIENNAAFYNAFNCNVTYKTDYPFPYIEVPEAEVPGA